MSEGQDINPDLDKIEEIFKECLRIIVDRGRGRDVPGKTPLWKRRGYKGTLMHMDSKMLRIMARFWDSTPAPEAVRFQELDDLYDLINYTAFTIINIAEGNPHG